MKGDNIIVKLIREKMEKDNWDADTPESFAAYLFDLTDEDIIEIVEKEIENENL